MRLNPLILIKFTLLLFLSIGVFLTVFMIKQEVKIVGAYVTAGLFILMPGFLFYGLTFGFSISEKTLKKQEERQESVSFDNKGISYKLPLFDTKLFLDWQNIDRVTYTNYQSDDHAKFIFLLAQPPIKTMEENPWWLNKHFSSAIKNKKEIIIEDDCRHFQEIPKMLEMYLPKINPIDLQEDNRKGTLVSSRTTVKNNTIQTEEYWTPNTTYEPKKVVYDKYNRS